MTNNEKAMKNIREAAELIASLASAPHPAPDARPEDTAEHFIQAAVDRSPEPLQRLGAMDAAAEAEHIARKALFAALSPPPLSPEKP